jgi:membrane protein implicated in regulation of membrane protease activity
VTSAQIVWLVLALLLMAGETLLPEVFLLWLGFAALAVFGTLLAAPDLPVVWQGVAFVVYAFASVMLYLKLFRDRQAPSDQPLLNRRGEQLVGQVFPLDLPIVDGRGRLKIGDAFWVAEGPDLPAGARVRVLAVRSMSLQVGPAD